jgi:hypothetical protein
MGITQSKLEEILKSEKYVNETNLTDALTNAGFNLNPDYVPGTDPPTDPQTDTPSNVPSIPIVTNPPTGGSSGSAWTYANGVITFSSPVVINGNLTVNSNCGNDYAAAACGIFNTGTYYGETGGNSNNVSNNNGHNSPRIYSPKIMGDGWQAPMIHGGNDNSQVDFPSGIISERAGWFKAGIVVTGPVKNSNGNVYNIDENNSAGIVMKSPNGDTRYPNIVSVNDANSSTSSAYAFPYGGSGAGFNRLSINYPTYY